MTDEQRTKQRVSAAAWKARNPERTAEISREYMRRKRAAEKAVKAGLPPPVYEKAKTGRPRKDVIVEPPRTADGRYPKAAPVIKWVAVVSVNDCGDLMTAYRARTPDGLSLPAQKHAMIKAGHRQPVLELYYMDGDSDATNSESALIKKLRKAGIL